MKFCIPTYKRYNIKTLRFLEGLSVDIFVANASEKALYDNAYPDRKDNIIIGVEGLTNQRNFISNYYDEDEIIFTFDDDLKDIRFINNSSREKWIKECCDLLEKGGLVTVAPHHNLYYIKKQGFTKSKYFGIGYCHVYNNDKHILKRELCEDYERSAYFIHKDGFNWRCHDIIVKHTGCPPGGLREIRTVAKQNLEINRVLYQYPNLCGWKYKRMLKEQPNLWMRKKTNITVTVLALPKPDIGNLFEECEKLTFMRVRDATLTTRNTGNRFGFPAHRVARFGVVKRRIPSQSKDKQLWGLSYDSQVKSDLYKKLIDIGESFVPFPFTNIHLVKDLVCPVHKDKGNVGDSCIISFGDYVGGELVINDKEYDARETPLIFNGHEHEHYNKKIISGTKYSVVYYNNSFTEYQSSSVV